MIDFSNFIAICIVFGLFVLVIVVSKIIPHHYLLNMKNFEPEIRVLGKNAANLVLRLSGKTGIKNDVESDLYLWIGLLGVFLFFLLMGIAIN